MWSFVSKKTDIYSNEIIFQATNNDRLSHAKVYLGRKFLTKFINKDIFPASADLHSKRLKCEWLITPSTPCIYGPGKFQVWKKTIRAHTSVVWVVLEVGARTCVNTHLLLLVGGEKFAPRKEKLLNFSVFRRPAPGNSLRRNEKFAVAKISSYHTCFRILCIGCARLKWTNKRGRKMLCLSSWKLSIYREGFLLIGWNLLFILFF